MNSSQTKETTMDKFPNFKSHAEAECFKCATVMATTVTTSGYGRGAYKQYCGKCRMWTWYDIKEAA